MPEVLEGLSGGTVVTSPEFGVIVSYKLTNGPMAKIFMRFDELQGFPDKFLNLMVREMRGVLTNDPDAVEEVKEKVQWLFKFRSEIKDMFHLFPSS